MTNVTKFPMPGVVTPATGVGVTFHDDDRLLSGTIVRAGPRIFWFRIDGDFEGAARLPAVKLG